MLVGLLESSAAEKRTAASFDGVVMVSMLLLMLLLMLILTLAAVLGEGDVQEVIAASPF